MKIHEYQAKELLREHGIPVPRGGMGQTTEEVEAAARALADSGVERFVVKAQIHAGGRGKGGGVKVTEAIDGPEGVIQTATRMLGMKLVTHQTRPEGQKVGRILVEEACAIARELYLGLVVDRETGRATVMASTEGGMDIEEVAARSPEKILRESVDPAVGFGAFQARNLGFGLGLEGTAFKQLQKLLPSLYRLFTARDCSLMEINPLVVTEEGSLLALDAKLNLDDNALFRHKDLLALRDHEEEDASELAAAAHGLSYIRLEGNIGCLVNGAGLAMATMDIIKLHGGEPANFLDVGGGASAEAVAEAFKIILEDKNVQGILVNIFGGIMKCDVIAQGVITAVKEVGIEVPLVVRLEGTNVELGKKMLEESGLAIEPAMDMTDAAKKAVAAAAQHGQEVS